MMLVRCYVAPSPIEGLGLFAGEDIQQGTEVWRLSVLVDKVFTRDEMASMPFVFKENVARHCTWERRLGMWLYCGDDARFMNHSDNPNIKDRNLILTAVCDIRKGEELTCTYNKWAQEHMLPPPKKQAA